jgi:hypothetical protein
MRLARRGKSDAVAGATALDAAARAPVFLLVE